jgi:LysM repeat protein
MMSYRRMLPFLLINIVVSAAVVLTILWIWDGRKEEPEPIVAVATPAPQAVSPLNEAPVAESAPDELSAQEPIITSDQSGPEVHIVAAGETLGQISARYDISLEEIMAANGMSNQNFIFVGQELIIPIEGAPQPAQEEVQQSTADTSAGNLPTPIPTEPASDGEAIIEIAQVSDPGQLPLEAVQIVNNGSRETNLAEWKLADQFGNYYEFRAMTLFGDGAGITVHTTSGQDSATDLYWGADEALWQSGSQVVLYDAAGNVIAQYQIP